MNHTYDNLKHNIAADSVCAIFDSENIVVDISVSGEEITVIDTLHTVAQNRMQFVCDLTTFVLPVRSEGRQNESIYRALKILKQH